MKKYRFHLLILLLCAAFLAPSCSQKSGCPMNESLKLEESKSGFKKKNKTQSGLFSKKMNKRMR